MFACCQTFAPLRHKLALVFAVASCLVPLSAVAQETPEIALQKLEKAVQAELQIPTKAPTERGGGNIEYQKRDLAERTLGQIRSSLGRGDFGTLDQMLYQLTSTFTTEPVKQAAANLGAVVKKEHDAKQAARLAELNTALTHASNAARSAKEPSELDAPLKELHQLQNFREEPMSEAGRNAQQKLQSTITFMERWQDYLSAEKNGNSNRAREALQNAVSNMGSVDIVPRSEVLARLQRFPIGDDTRTETPKSEQINEIVGKIKTLDGVADAIKELHKIQSRSRPNYSSGSDPLASTVNALVSIERTYREFKAGLPTRLDFSPPSSSDPSSPNLVSLRAQLYLLVLPRYLNLPPELNPKPAETVQQFLERIMDEARKRGDTGLLSRAKDAQRSITTGSYYTGFDNNTTNSVVAAQNQETAGQFMLAVISYQNALKSGGEAVPAKLIGERLAALKANHPEEYEQGMSQFLNPMPRGFERPPMPAYTPGRFGPPGPPTVPMPIPAASMSAAPTATVSASPKPGESPVRP